MELDKTDKPVALAKNAGIEEAEAAMLNMPQVPAPVIHRFGPTDPETGMHVYIREVILPAGSIAIGHFQKKRHLNQVICGKVAVVNGDGVKVIEGPSSFIGEPGKKAGYVMETCVWQNLYLTDKTDIAEIEEEFLDKSETSGEFEEQAILIKHRLATPDRTDYELMLYEYDLTEETVREQSENKEDQMEMPEEWRSIVSIRPSPIEGKGMFLSLAVDKNVVIAPARMGEKRTPAGRYVNHSANPNCAYVKADNGDVYLMSIRPIEGCRGGGHGEELTVDYRQGLSLAGVYRKRGKK